MDEIWLKPDDLNKYLDLNVVSVSTFMLALHYLTPTFTKQ